MKNFHSKIWESIRKFKLNDDGSDASNKFQNNNDYRSLERSKSKRSTSYIPDKTDISSQQRHVYGNRVFLIDVIQTEIATLQKPYLQILKSIVPCQEAKILFVNQIRDELCYTIDERWYRVPISSTFAGICATNGEVLIIDDVQGDIHFNRNIDNLNKFKTKTMLCLPMRMSHGSGPLVAVLQLLNKHDGIVFDNDDVNILFRSELNIFEQLTQKFRNLLEMAEPSNGLGQLVGGDIIQKSSHIHNEESFELYLKRLDRQINKQLSLKPMTTTSNGSFRFQNITRRNSSQNLSSLWSSSKKKTRSIRLQENEESSPLSALLIKPVSRKPSKSIRLSSLSSREVITDP